jgi:O-antigen ligase
LILPIIPEQIGRVRILPPARTRSRVFVTVGIALIAGATIGKVMTTLAASGALGDKAQQKNQVQTTQGWGILLGGRPEILVSSRAVIDSPILGHGSEAKDSKYTRMLADIENEYGAKTPDTLGEKYGYLIPTHSHLMSAWVYAGILGAVFWIYIIVLTAKAIVTTARSQLPLKPVYISLLVLFMWDIMFSPFAGLRRVTTSLFIVFICDILDPDSPRRQIVAQTFARTQVQSNRRNLGRIAPRFRPDF